MINQASLYNKINALPEGLQRQVLDFVDFLQSRHQDTQRVSLEQYNRELDEANARVEAGDYLTQEQVEEASRQWLSE